MNKTRIDWADHTWNPITGCNGGCSYCYARPITRRYSGNVRLNMNDPQCVEHSPGLYELDSRFTTDTGKAVTFPFGFAPTLHRYRYKELAKYKNSVNIFVCSMADMFGRWVPESWIQEIFEAIARHPQHNYLFLTKNPARYAELAAAGRLPQGDNYWYGTTTTSPYEAWPPVLAGYNTFVSVEPMLAEFAPEDITDIVARVGWVIIGPETGNHRGKHIPAPGDIAAFEEEAQAQAVPLFMKEKCSWVFGEKAELKQQFPYRLLTKPPSEAWKAKNWRRCAVTGELKPVKEMSTISIVPHNGEPAAALGYVSHTEQKLFMRLFTLKKPLGIFLLGLQGDGGPPVDMLIHHGGKPRHKSEKRDIITGTVRPIAEIGTVYIRKGRGKPAKAVGHIALEHRAVFERLFTQPGPLRPWLEELKE